MKHIIVLTTDEIKYLQDLLEIENIKNEDILSTFPERQENLFVRMLIKFVTKSNKKLLHEFEEALSEKNMITEEI